MCESLLLQKADGAIVPGLASLSTPTQKTLVFTINPKATFWDGHPVTPADVVYSLDRQMNPSLGGFYGQVFSRVKTIEQTGQDQVTITLNQPDYWLEGELSSMAGVVIEKAYAQQEGKNYGTPARSPACPTTTTSPRAWRPAPSRAPTPPAASPPLISSGRAAR
jgi:peptide/nickel transport system substrate-binding protein